ncbi:MAG: type IV secretory system conjugative DNA transfer family protein [Rhodopila sp.]
MQHHHILMGRQGREYLRFEGSEHVALYARTGSGKSSNVCIPNCFSWRGSLVVLDIKGECFRVTAGYRKYVLGQDVYLFDPAAVTGRTHCWNPLQAVDRDSAERFDAISRQAFLLFPDASVGSGGMSSSDAFWTPAARGAMTAVATLLAETQGRPFNLAEVLRLFSRGDSLDELAKMIADRRRSSLTNYSRIVVDGVSDYLNGSEDQVHSIRKMTSTRLQPWFNPKIAASTAVSDFDLRQIRRRPMTIYVTVQPGNIARMRPILALFFDALINLNTDATPEEDPTIQHQTLVILDEFVRLGRMESLAEAAQYVRGYGMRLLYVVQNKAQLRAKYGTDAAEDIFDNTGAEIVFGTNDHKLTKELEERLGNDTIDVVTRNRPRFWAWANWSKQSEAEHPHRRPIMLAQEIARMPREKQIILRAGMQPMLTDRAYWVTDPNFSTLVYPLPPVPALDFAIDVDDGQTEILSSRRKGQTQDITAADVEPVMDDETDAE